MDLRPKLIVDVYGLDLSGSLIKESRHILECGYSCGNVDGRIVPVDNTTCRVILGDLSNYTEATVVEFTIDSIRELYIFDWSQIDYDIYQVYFLDKNLIFVSDVVGFDTNCIGIRVLNLADNNIFGEQIVFKCGFTHKYTDKPNELESKIIQMIDNKYVLIKIKLINSISVLKIIEEDILVLVDVVSGQAKSIKRLDKNQFHAYVINSNLEIGLLKLNN